MKVPERSQQTCLDKYIRWYYKLSSVLWLSCIIIYNYLVVFEWFMNILFCIRNLASRMKALLLKTLIQYQVPSSSTKLVIYGSQRTLTHCKILRSRKQRMFGSTATNVRSKGYNERCSFSKQHPARSSWVISKASKPQKDPTHSGGLSRCQGCNNHGC